MYIDYFLLLQTYEKWCYVFWRFRWIHIYIYIFIHIFSIYVIYIYILILAYMYFYARCFFFLLFLLLFLFLFFFSVYFYFFIRHSLQFHIQSDKFWCEQCGSGGRTEKRIVQYRTRWHISLNVLTRFLYDSTCWWSCGQPAYGCATKSSIGGGRLITPVSVGGRSQRAPKYKKLYKNTAWRAAKWIEEKSIYLRKGWVLKSAHFEVRWRLWSPSAA